MIAPLTSAQLAGVARAQQVALTPLGYLTPEAWMQAVNEELKMLFDAEHAVFLLTTPAGPATVTDLDEGIMESYIEHFARTDVAITMLGQHPCPYAIEGDFEGHPLVAR